MKPLPCRARLALLFALVLPVGFSSLAQSPAPVRPLAPRPIQLAPNPSQSNPDPFSTLIGSAASIDMDAPVAARAEFDPAVAPQGSRVLYRIVLNALDESIKLPEQLPAPAGLRFTAGGRGQAYQPVGGQKLAPQTTLLYHVTAAAPGAFTMPPFPISVYSKTVMVPAARLTVTAPAASPVREAPRLVLELPDGNIYAGQTIKVRVLLLDPGDGSVQGLSSPHISGESIFSEPISFGRRDTIRRNGQTYPAFLNEIVITPMRAGEEEIVAQGHSISTRLIQGQGGVFQSYNALIDSDPVKLTVKPLPKEGQLPGFTGAIGVFQLDAPKLSTNEVRAGDPLTLAVTVRGDGNIGRLTPPQLQFQREWQTFPPLGDSGPAYLAMQRGFTTFSYTLIPLSDRVKATPAIPFSYFDPQRSAYVDLTIAPVPLTVKPAPAGSAVKLQPLASGAPPAEADEASFHERELVLSGLAETPGRSAFTLAALQQRWWFLAFQLLPAAALAGLWSWDRRRRYLALHPEVIRKRRAQRGLRRQLRLARRASAARDAAGFVTGAINALREACAPHGAANPEALVCADVLRELPPPERQGQPGEAVRRLFAAADALRFGGASKETSDLLSLQPDLERLLDHLRARL